jgi:phage I-like protein
MTTHRFPCLVGLALNFESGTAPDWVQLTPPGPVIVGRDGRAWKMSDAEAVAAAYDPGKEPQIDIEHSSQQLAPQGLPAPAVGWIAEIAVRDGALWGRVNWTADGAAAVASRAYRYLSPAFRFDPKTGEVLQIVSAGLTNTPNFEMAALNAARTSPDMERSPMDQSVLEALGLQPTATAADAVAAITTLRTARDTALNAAQVPDLSRFVPRADHDVALNRIRGFEAAEAAARDARIVEAVDAAVAAGKIAPASKDYHLAACRQEGGLDRFVAMVASAPVIAAASGLDGRTPDGTPGRLTADELAMCRMLGTDPEKFAAEKAAQALRPTGRTAPNTQE